MRGIETAAAAGTEDRAGIIRAVRIIGIAMINGRGAALQEITEAVEAGTYARRMIFRFYGIVAEKAISGACRVHDVAASKQTGKHRGHFHFILDFGACGDRIFNL